VHKPVEPEHPVTEKRVRRLADAVLDLGFRFERAALGVADTEIP
jgi:hypothetical protein